MANWLPLKKIDKSSEPLENHDNVKSLKTAIHWSVYSLFGGPGEKGEITASARMKLLMSCLDCALTAEDARESISYVELRDDAYYELECNRGHRRSAILTERKFAVLFESGAMALLDGYTREAVSSFAASLERFYEYWIKAVLLAAGTTHEMLEQWWKLVAAQSERQYGAFCALYQREYARHPHVLPNRQVEFRNNVIHRGYLPQRSEVVEYDSGVLRIIVELYAELYETRYKGISDLEGIELGKAYFRAADRTKLSTVAVATVFSDVAASKGQMSLETALEHLARRREGLYSP